MKHIDLLIYQIGQLLTCAAPNGPLRGEAMQQAQLISDCAVAIHHGRIIDIGPSTDILKNYTSTRSIDAQNKVVCPGFVDPHTHVVYAGNRINEFEMRIKGASYMEIMAAGGGIVSTMAAVREADVIQMVTESVPRLHAMMRLGTTTVEIKSGYGLDTTSEIKMLRVIEAISDISQLDIIPTFMGAHAIPPEYRQNPAAYTDLVIEEMLPAAAEWHRQSRFAAAGQPLFNDVFCEQNAFDVDQSRRILEKGIELGLPAKIHVDEFNALGGLTMAVDLGVVSADHLDATTAEERDYWARSNVVGVILPAVNFNLGSHHFAAARAMIDAGGTIALSTDINPGSAPCPSMPLVMAIACRYQQLLPIEAFHAATINAAYAIGRQDDLGSVELHKQADLLVLNTDDYRTAAYEFGGNPVQIVIKRGKVAYDQSI